MGPTKPFYRSKLTVCQLNLQNLPRNIAIDGPAASGKSTIGTLVANKIGYMCLDTGIMYRAVAFQALKEGLNISDEAQISSLAERIEIDILPASSQDGRQFDVMINGEDHTGTFAARKSTRLFRKCLSIPACARQ